jgi:hypothetical protein
MLFMNQEELIAKAEELSENSESAYKNSVYLYFIARYFVLNYEAKFGEIPIQVWNEYRNTLDHFFRHITQKDTNHVPKMEGHLQRAALDIIKIFCHHAQDLLKDMPKQYRQEVLLLVDNGIFINKINNDRKYAEDLFVQAKMEDSRLGDDAQNNKNVLKSYLDAVFAFDQAYNYFEDKKNDIENAQNNYNAIHDKAAKGTFKEHMKTHFIFYVLWTIGVLGLSEGSKYLWNNGLKANVNNVFQSDTVENNKVIDSKSSDMLKTHSVNTTVPKP